MESNFFFESDPKLKNAFGKFIANDHCSEVFYGVVLKFDRNHESDFFEGDTLGEYSRPNSLRVRRKDVIASKETARKNRVKQQRAQRKVQKKKK